MRRAASLAAACLLAGQALAAEGEGVIGAWSGTYRCAQGLTGVTLTVTQAQPETAEALFPFYADPRNPGVPTGCFLLQGRYDPASGRLSLRGGPWLLRPPGYVVVDFLAQVDPTGRGFSGRVAGPGCSSVQLERRKAAAVPAACRTMSEAGAEALLAAGP
ncbi:hypothetical protein JYK14_19710 [Siccirubricoccus sp. KC 17139]|uniref:Uncharacterized protein n=1 Tax=Siccirubricoccus soli TaxID=2899147 RepID=A0ABT1D8X2_9PROT|nr:hypothetical protein [Siccirubricoccus soli]MCO6418374.1 hypothetical protein [Siccirubricoccus soli]MCP2684509.1 hypothetical protein [Siccirubricoccus soli]